MLVSLLNEPKPREPLEDIPMEELNRLMKEQLAARKLEQIQKLLNENPQGLRRSEIASELHRDRSETGRFMYHHQDCFWQDDDYRWHNIGLAEEVINPVMLKLQNRENALEFTIEEFEDLADWDKMIPNNTEIESTVYVTETGREILCDSASEVLMLEYLEDNDLAEDIGAQNLGITYHNAFGRAMTYYPDFWVLTKDHHIAVIEVKAATAMDYHKNMEKYKALADYCEENGYMYMEVDPADNFLTVEELRDCDDPPELMEIMTDLHEQTKESEEPIKLFDGRQVTEWFYAFGEGYTRREFDKMVHSYVLLLGWYNRFSNGFMVFSKPTRNIV